jgi:hypothetical protein
MFIAMNPFTFRLWHQRLNIPMCSAAQLKLRVRPRSSLFERQPLNQGPYHEQIPGWPTTWPIEWQNCPFWQTVFDGPQAHGADDGCSALQDIAGGLGLATCRPLASAKPTDMAIARKLITKVFSMVSSSLDDAGMDAR